MKKFLAGIIALFCICFSQTAEACSCYELTVAENVKAADIVFSGRVLSVIRTNNFDSMSVITHVNPANEERMKDRLRFPVRAVRIVVDTVYKGSALSDTITILTPFNGAACGYSFEAGFKYIVYATVRDAISETFGISRKGGDGDTFWTHHCTRTCGWHKEEEDAIRKAVQ